MFLYLSGDVFTSASLAMCSVKRSNEKLVDTEARSYRRATQQCGVDG